MAYPQVHEGDHSSAIQVIFRNEQVPQWSSVAEHSQRCLSILTVTELFKHRYTFEQTNIGRFGR